MNISEGLSLFGNDFNKMSLFSDANMKKSDLMGLTLDKNSSSDDNDVFAGVGDTLFPTSVFFGFSLLRLVVPFVEERGDVLRAWTGEAACGKKGCI